MLSVSRRVRQKVFAAAAVAVLLAGGALAAVSATGQSSARKHTAREVDGARATRVSAKRRLQVLFASSHSVGTVAAGYLGVAPSKLQAELHSGKTLAELAAASAGKTEAGLVAALVAAKQQRFAKAVAAGKLTAAKRAKRQARLQRRIARLVQRDFA
jgi:hypothetical protein